MKGNNNLKQEIIELRVRFDEIKVNFEKYPNPFLTSLQCRQDSFDTRADAENVVSKIKKYSILSCLIPFPNTE